ncbi:hypothetical protein T484DRAFT_2083078 [Baffinella frigidus]|nr:hypothetical protein T484DRAFT_2083078 [Cryptophyta sp. CCMP2293]
MVVLGGVRFLMSEVPLYATLASERAVYVKQVWSLHPPRCCFTTVACAVALGWTVRCNTHHSAILWAPTTFHHFIKKTAEAHSEAPSGAFGSRRVSCPIVPCPEAGPVSCPEAGPLFCPKAGPVSRPEAGPLFCPEVSPLFCSAVGPFICPEAGPSSPEAGPSSVPASDSVRSSRREKRWRASASSSCPTCLGGSNVYGTLNSEP